MKKQSEKESLFLMGKRSENKEILIASVINYVTFAFNILIAIFYTPFLLKALGDVDYGIRSFAISFVAYANIIGTGISTAYLRFANLKKNENGDKGVKDIDGVFLKIFLFLSLAVLSIGILLFVFFLTGIIPLKNYSNDQVFVISTVVLLSFITLCIKLPLATFLLILNFSRKFIYRNTRFLLSAVFEYLFSFLCLILGITIFKSSVIALSVVSLISESLFGIITLIYVLFILKHKINFKAKVVDKNIWKEIFRFSILSLMIIAVMSLNDSTDRIILGFISAESVTFYSLAIIFNAYIKSGADSLSVLFTPRITEQATRNQQEEVQKSFDFVSKICIILMSFIIFGYVVCGKEFLTIWLGKERVSIYYYSLPLLLGMIFLYPQHFSIQIHRAYGKQKFAAIALAITFLINIGVSIGLVFLFKKYMDNPVLGCIVGTLFTYVCEATVLSIYNHKKLNLKQWNVWIEVIVNLLIGFAICIVILRLIGLVNFNLAPGYMMLIKGIIYVAIFGLVQFILNRKDFLKLFKWRKHE